MLEPIDYEIPEPVSIAKCECCKNYIMIWEDYYKIGDDAVHDDCIIEYIRRFKINK